MTNEIASKKKPEVIAASYDTKTPSPVTDWTGFQKHAIETAASEEKTLKRILGESMRIMALSQTELNVISPKLDALLGSLKKGTQVLQTLSVVKRIPGTVVADPLKSAVDRGFLRNHRELREVVRLLTKKSEIDGIDTTLLALKPDPENLLRFLKYADDTRKKTGAEITAGNLKELAVKSGLTMSKILTLSWPADQETPTPPPVPKPTETDPAPDPDPDPAPDPDADADPNPDPAPLANANEKAKRETRHENPSDGLDTVAICRWLGILPLKPSQDVLTELMIALKGWTCDASGKPDPQLFRSACRTALTALENRAKTL